MSAAVQRSAPDGRLARLVGIVVTFVVVLSALAIGAPIGAPVARAAMPAPTGPNWGACPANGWLSQSAPDPAAGSRWVTRLSSVEVASSHVSRLRSWYEDETAVRQLNAIAFNSRDGFLYGFRIATAGTPNEFVRIDSNSNFQYLGLPGGWAAQGLPPQDDGLNIVVGDIDNEGFYWVLVPGQPNDYWVQIRLSDWTVADHGEIDPADPALNGLAGGADWAYQAGTNYLFRVMRTVGGSNPALVAFNKVTKTWTYAGLLTAPNQSLPTPPNSQYGAIYAAADGSMYAGNNPTGTIWVFRPGDPTVFYSRNAVQGLSHGEVEGNDAARCNTAVVEVDFGDAPDAYGTLRDSDGARHSVLPLAIGSVVDTENDAPAALLDGNGDDQTAADDEDAFGGTIQLGGLGPQSLQVTVINNTDEPATLIGYLDMNQANGFEGSEASNVVTVPPHLTAGHLLTWNVPAVVSGASYVRLRLASGSTVAGPTGVVYGGEVEDHPVNFTPPAPTYSLAKRASVPDGNVVSGSDITYFVDVTNPGPVPAPVSFTDDLTGILDDAELISGPDNGATIGADNVLSWSGTVPPNETVTVQYTVRVKQVGGDGLMANTVAGGPCGPCTTTHRMGYYTVEKWVQAPDDGDTVLPGQPIDYLVIVRGHGAAPVTATFTDDLSGVLDDAALNLPLADGLTQSGNNVTWTGTVNPGEHIDLPLSVTVRTNFGDGVIRNRILGPNCLEDATAAPCVTQNTTGGYTVSKSANPPASTAVKPGDTVTYTVTVTHRGPAAVPASWRDDLSNVLDDAEPPTSLPAGVTRTGNVLNWSGTSSPGAPQTFTYSVRVKAPLGDGTLTNAVAPGPVNTPGGSCGTCTISNPAGTFSVTKTSDRAANEALVVGDEVAYTITVTHDGDAPVTASWTDDLSAVLDDAELLAPLPAGVTRTGNVLSWSGTMNPGDAPRAFTYRVRVKATLTNGILTNRVVPGTGGTPCAPIDPACGEELQAGTYTVAKTSNRAGDVTAGQDITYTITVTPHGAATVPATWSDDLSDVLDDADLVGALPAGVTRTGNVLNWSGTVTPGTPRTFQYTVRVKSTLGNGVLNNAATSGSGGTCDPCETTNRAGTYTTVKTTPGRAAGTAVKAGDVITYRITVAQSGPGAVTGATVTDNLSDVLDDATAVGTPTQSATITGNTLSWTGNLAVGQTVNIDYQVRVTATGGNDTIRNVITSLSCPAGSNSPSCSVTHPQAGYTTSKATTGLGGTPVPSGTVLAPGNSLRYVLRLTHFGNAAYTGATLTDNLSDVLDDATFRAQPQADKPGLTFDGTTITWTGDLAIGEVVTITYTVDVKDVTALGDGALTNAVVGANCAAGATAAPCATNHPIGSYIVTKTGAPSATPLRPGGTVAYTITIAQEGQGAVTGASIADNLSDVLDDATITTAPTAGATITGNTLSWTGNLAVGQTVTITYTATVRAASQQGNGRIVNTVTGPNCPAASCTNTELVRAYTVVKSSTPPAGTQVSPGGTIAYRLTVTNTGGLAIADATVSDSLASILDDATVTAGPTSGATITGNTLNWTGALAVDQVVHIDYTVTLKAYAQMGDEQLTNAVASPEAGCPSPPITNPSSPSFDADCVTVHDAPQLTVAKSSTPADGTNVEPGQTIQYRISVTNTGTAAIPAATVTDNLSGVLDDATFVGNPAASSGTATRTGNTLTWTGAVPGGATVTITYSVTVKPASQQGDGAIRNVATSPNTPCATAVAGCSVEHLVEAMTINKASDPATGATVIPGQQITYTVTMRNTGGAPLMGRTFTDDLSDVLDDTVWNGPAVASSGTASFAPATNILSWTGNLAVDQTVTVTYRVTMRPAYQMGNGEIDNVVVAPDTECLVCGSDLETSAWDVHKVPSAAEVTPGSTIDYDIIVTNRGSTDLTDLSWTDDLSGILDDAELIGTPTADAGEVDYTAPVITWTGDLVVDEVATITYSARVFRPLRGDRSLTNAVVSDRPDGPCPESDDMPDRCRGDVPGRELTVEKAVEPEGREFAEPGDTVFYTLTITNTGALDYATATVTDDLAEVLDDAAGPTPAQITVTGPGSASFDGATGILTWTGPIAVDEVAVVRYAVTVNQTVTGDAHLINVVTSTDPGVLCPAPAIIDPEAEGYDPNCVTDTPIKAYEIDKASDPEDGTEVEPGDTITYTLTLTNTGDVDVNGETVTDDLSGVLDDAALDGDPVASAGDVSITDTTLTWTGDIPVGEVITVTYVVIVNRSDELGDAIVGNLVAGTGPSDCAVPPALGPTPDENEDCTTSSNVKAYTIMKASDPVAGTEIEPGDEVVYTITLTNTGTVDLTELTVTDSLTDILDDADVTVEPEADAGSVERVDDVITWTGDLAIEEVVTITYTVVVQPVLELGDGDLRNPVVGDGPAQCVDPVILDEEDPAFDPNCVNIVPIKAYTIVKASDPGDGTIVQPFDRVTYTLTIDNVGTAPLTDLTVTDDLADVLDDATLDGAPTATAGAVAVADAVLTWTGGLAVDETVTVTYVAVLHAPTALGDSHLANVVVGTGPTSCPEAVDPSPEDPDAPEDPADPDDPEDPEAPAPVVYEDCSTDHGVAAYTTLKEVLTPAPRPGEQASYRITITSVGSEPIIGETISDDLSGVLDDATWDNTATFSAGNPATTGAVSFAAPTLSWTGDIAVDDVLVITYSVTLNPQITGDGWLRNTVRSNDCPFLAAAGSFLAFANPAMPPNCRTDSAIPSVAFTKTVSPAGPFKPGDVVTYTITATNNGQVNLDGVSWSDDVSQVLDDADMVGQPSADRGAASYSLPIVSWVGSLAAREVAHVTYQVTIRESRGDGSMPNGVIGVGPASNCPTSGAAVECQTLALVLPAGVDLDPTDPGQLPRTGGDVGGLLTIGALLLAVGLGLEVLRRRRRRPAPS